MAEDEELHHPNDSFNRKWFGDPGAAADVLGVLAPESLKPLIIPANLHRESVSFVDKWLRPSQSDILWRCQDETGAVRAFFYVLWEHQTKIDVWMALRIFCYMAKIWERWLLALPSEEEEEGGKAKPKRKRARPALPLIFPIVLYQGKPRWTAPRTLAELAGELPADFRRFFPDFEFHLETLNRPASDFPPGLAQLGISVMKLSWDGNFGDWLERFATQMLDLHERGERDKLDVLLIYAISQVHRSKRQELIQQIHEHLKPMVTTGESIYDALIEEGMEKGMEKGMERLVRSMRGHGMSILEIAEVTDLPEDEVRQLLAADSDSES